MKSLDEIIKEFEVSEIMECVRAVESVAQIHGASDYHGQTLQDFLRQTIEQRDVELMAQVAGMKVSQFLDLSNGERIIQPKNVGFNAALDAVLALFASSKGK